MTEKSNGVCCFLAYWYQTDRFGLDFSALFLFTWCDLGWHKCSCLPATATSLLGEGTSIPQGLLSAFIMFIPGKEVAGADMQGSVWRHAWVGLCSCSARCRVMWFEQGRGGSWCQTHNGNIRISNLCSAWNVPPAPKDLESLHVLLLYLPT